MCILDYGEIYSTYNVYMLFFMLLLRFVLIALFRYMVKLKTNVYFVDNKAFYCLIFLIIFWHWVLFNTFYHESFQQMQNKTMSGGDV